MLIRVRVCEGLYSINLVSGNLLMHFSSSFNLVSVVFSGRKSADILQVDKEMTKDEMVGWHH